MKANTLLVVEDEDLILELLENALVDAGFEVTLAGSGVQAVGELNADARRFSAVITDIRLGSGPDGWEVGRRTRELVPDMPIIYVSGDSAHDWPSKGVPNSVLVSKPFAPAQIVSAIATLLDGGLAPRPPRPREC